MIGLLFSRYLISHEPRHRSRNIRILLGLVFSTLVLSTVLSVMDYMQEGRFDELKSIRSFPVVIEGGEDMYDELIKEYSDRAIVFRYRTGEGLLRTDGNTLPVLIRYIDDGYAGAMNIVGKLEDGVLLPFSIFRALGSSYEINLSRLESGNRVRNTIRERSFNVDGLYRTALSDSFDSSMLFMSYDSAPTEALYHLAFIPLTIDEDELYEELKDRNIGAVIFWKDAEESLYGAMLLEKIVMLILLSSLFLIVLVEIHNDANLFAQSRKRELGALDLMGVERRYILSIFTLLGSCLALFGSLVGLVLSYGVLKLIPLFSSAFYGDALLLDTASLAVMITLVVLLSALLYFNSFRRVLVNSAVDAAIREV